MQRLWRYVSAVMESGPQKDTAYDSRKHMDVSLAGLISGMSSRIPLLVCLLLFQSVSQFILEAHEGLISQHVAVPLFLTMLVGAGGNAGNQAAVRSITGLVSGEFRKKDVYAVVRKEILVAAVSAVCLCVICFFRVHFFYTRDADSNQELMFATVTSVSLSLVCIVFSSVVIGAALPFGLVRLGWNVEHAAPIIQVVMDILGVWITCTVASQLLPTTAQAPISPQPSLLQTTNMRPY